MAKEIVIDLVLDNAQAAQSLGQMKSSLRELQEAIINVPEGSESWGKLTQKAAELKDKMGDAREQINAIAGEPLENLQSGLGGVQQKLSSLDFGGTAAQVNLMGNSLKNLKLKDLSEGIGNVGKSFLNFGKALLSNPIFLIAAAVAGIVAILYKLKDAGGIITKMFDAMSEVVSSVVSGLKALSDAIGLTDYAGLAEKQRDYNAELKKEAELVDAATKARIEYYEQTAKGWDDFLAGRIADMENEKLQMELNGKSALEILKYETKQRKEIKRMVEQTAAYSKKNVDEIKGYNQFLLESVRLRKQLNDLEDNEERKKIITEINLKTAQINDNLTTQSILQKEVEQAGANLTAGLITEDAWRNTINQKINASKKALNELMPLQKDLLVLQTKLANVDAITSEKRKNNSELNLGIAKVEQKTTEDINALTEEQIKLNEKVKIQLQDINNLYINRRKDVLSKIQDIESEFNSETYKQKKELIEQEFIDRNTMNIQWMMEGIISFEEYKQTEYAIEEKYDRKMFLLRAQNLQDYFALASDILGQLDSLNSEYAIMEQSRIDSTRVKKLNALDNTLMSEEAYEAAKTQIDAEAFDREEKLRKQQFNANKALKMANTIVAGGEAVIAALTLPPPFGEIAAAARAVTTAAQVALIAKTQYVPTLNSDRPGYVPNTFSTSTGAGSITSPTNSTLFGAGGNPFVTVTPFEERESAGGTGSKGGSKSKGMVRVYVVENDITETQKKSEKIRTTVTLQ